MKVSYSKKRIKSNSFVNVKNFEIYDEKKTKRNLCMKNHAFILLNSFYSLHMFKI